MDHIGKWYESTVRQVGSDGRVYIHYNPWEGTRWDEWIAADSNRLAPLHTYAKAEPKISSTFMSGSSYSSSWDSSDAGTPEARGAVGLQNLGNTYVQRTAARSLLSSRAHCVMCSAALLGVSWYLLDIPRVRNAASVNRHSFVCCRVAQNSTLQCLSHTPHLNEFFTDDEYLPRINRTNPLGWHGKVAEEWGNLVKELWSNKYRVVAPRKFKDAIGEFAPRFSGYQQQDSSELLSFLLDGLHEDLNQVKNKPPTKAVESKGRPDEIVAAEAWAVHQLRNQSVIVDRFQGQLKSTLVCPTCARVSITFDPFMFLSVPLPTVTDKLQEVTLYPHDQTKPPTVYAINVSKIGSIADIKNGLAALSHTSARSLVLGTCWGHRVWHFLADDASIADSIRAGDSLLAWEVPDMEQKGEEMVPIQVQMHRLEPNPVYDKTYEYSREFTSEAFGTPRVIALPKRLPIPATDIRKQYDDRPRRLTSSLLPISQLLNLFCLCSFLAPL